MTNPIIGNDVHFFVSGAIGSKTSGSYGVAVIGGDLVVSGTLYGSLDYRKLVLFMNDGPAEGYSSGTYKQTLPLGSAFPTSHIWWESAAMLKKIVSLDITRNTSYLTPSTEVWKLYAADGVTALVTVTDAITYSGVYEATRTRTIS